MMQVCYWIIGLDTQVPFVRFDLHDANGSVIARQISGLPKACRNKPKSLLMNAHTLASHYARMNGATRVTHDMDSTKYSRRD